MNQVVVAGPGIPIDAVGSTLVVKEWTGSGPDWMHVHHEDDEAWHVLEGTLRFRTLHGDFDAPAGTSVFVPAGTPHTYQEVESARYLIMMSPRLAELIERLHGMDEHADLDELLEAYRTSRVAASGPSDLDTPPRTRDPV